jgi:trimeric autotransporter adhesin
MKFKLLIIATLIISFVIIFRKPGHNKPEKKIQSHGISANAITYDMDEDEEGEDGIRAAQEMEFENTRDIKLGYIPKSRLVAAYTKLINLRKLSPNTPTGSSSLSWTERGPNSDTVGPSDGNIRAGGGIASGRMRAIWVDLSDPTYHKVWVGGIDGGLWETNDISASPATWTPINDFFGDLAVSSICQDPLGSNKDTLYFGTGEKTFNADAVRGGGIWKSTDHGATWNLLTSTTSFYNVSKIICDTVGNVYVACIGSNNTGIERSMDGGNTWTDITPVGLNSNVTDMKLSSTGRLHIVCGYNNGANPGYRFTDNPATVTSSGWTAPTTPFPNVQYNCELAVSGNTLYVLPSNSSYQTPQIYKSVDGGNNWSPTATSPPAASGTNDLSSGQAWYNLALAVDPANGQNVIAGGLNCYRSTDGGNTWSQVSTWVGSTLSYIHADQQTAVWIGNQVLVGSDGGIFYSSDGGATFKDRNAGLRIRQYYSCAIHPTRTNYFLAGAQDNGVNQLTNTGLGGCTEVTGGDGAFVQIDQNQPQFQYGSYVYNQYRRSTDGGVTWNNVDYSSSAGQFINPTDLDYINDKMYAGAANNQYIRWEEPHYGTTFTPVTINAFSGSVKCIKVSPHTSNRVFFGTNSGKIVMVDNANLSSPAATDLTGSGMPGATVSCIAIGTNDSNMIATYSNYGVSGHIWVTNTGGGSGGWANITGNFPDIPVRWALFYPDDNTKAIIATEMGVYETNLINGSSTIWTQDPTFPIVRTDMLKYRQSDGTILAATHGRGLWTAIIPKTIPYIRFTSPYITETEATTGTTGCRNYTDYTINMAIDLPPAGDAKVTLGVDPGNSATQGVDFDFTTNGSFTSPSNILTFPSGSASNQSFTIRIYDDAEVENTESFTLTFIVSGSTNAMASPGDSSFTFTIMDNDAAPVYLGGSNTFTIGTASYYLGTTSAGQPFDAKLPSKRNQMLYKASELIAAGVTRGTITSVAFNINKSSIRPYQNLQIKMGLTTVSELVDNSTVTEIPTSTVKSLPSYSTVNGINTFTLDVPFTWDGTSNLVIEICYNNGTGAPSDFADRTIGYNDGSNAYQGNLMWQDSIDCGTSFSNVTYYSMGTKPQIKLTVSAFGNLIDTSGSHTEYVASNGTFYFYDNKNILNSISGASGNLGCLSSVLTGTGTTWQPFYGGMMSGKMYDITPSTNPGASYTIGLYYTSDELGGYNPSILQIAKSDATSISNVNVGNTIIGNTTYAAYGNGYVFTAPFTGFSKFFLVNPGVVLPLSLLSFNATLQKDSILLKWSTSSEQGALYFSVEKSLDGNNFDSVGAVIATGYTTIKSNYSFTDHNVSAINYYRLKMVDKDGKFVYSSTVIVQNPNAPQQIWVGNNPFQNLINIRLAKTPTKNVSVELFNIGGAKVFSKNYGVQNQISIDLSYMNLSKGIYVLKTVIDGEPYINKLIKQ